MAGYIQKINTTIPNSQNTVSIDLQGRNLILTGGNGCGKTRLLEHIYQVLHEQVVLKQNTDERQLMQHISHYENAIKIDGKAGAHYNE
jgi:recombinational DNA repair ATPase RecF